MDRPPALVLASASPRRAQILNRLALRFLQIQPRVDEEKFESGTPSRLVQALARAKADDVGPRTPPGSFTLAADTLVALDGRVVGKPRDAAHARTLLLELSGRWHHVWTGVAVRSPAGLVATDAIETRVEFSPLSIEQIEAYVATGEPLDKAGAYGIQTLPAGWLRTVDGDYDNVVGLPVRSTLDLLRTAGYPLPAHLKV